MVDQEKNSGGGQSESGGGVTEMDARARYHGRPRILRDGLTEQKYPPMLDRDGRYQQKSAL